MLDTDLQKRLLCAGRIPDEVMHHIFERRWLQIWVPKAYCGLGLSFKEGLNLLKRIARIDGSLGWMVTLCAGANYFSRNLPPKTARQLFAESATCFGGSGMVGGTASKEGSRFLINGTWHFATGAPHLSHFTLNATLTENGKIQIDAAGNPKVRSFIVPKDQVEIIADWQAMGMIATGTYTFEVHDVWVDECCSFLYDEFYTNSALDKIPFRIFADLTLLVNYVGMSMHFLEEAEKMHPELDSQPFRNFIDENELQVCAFADEIEQMLETGTEITADKRTEIHRFASSFVDSMSHRVIDLYFRLGLKAAYVSEPIHQIFRDYFTATQHANFRKKDSC